MAGMPSATDMNIMRSEKYGEGPERGPGAAGQKMYDVETPTGALRDSVRYY